MKVFFFSGIYGGFLLGVRSVNGLAFYDWENTELIRRIEIQPKHVIWPSWFNLFFLLFCKFKRRIYTHHWSFVLCVQIFWSDSGELVCIATEESFFILRYMADKVAASQENNEGVTEDGIEDAFEVGSLIRFIVFHIKASIKIVIKIWRLYLVSLCPFVFQVQGEIQEIVKTGLWVGDCFIYTSSVNRLNYYVGGEIVTIAHLDR